MSDASTDAQKPRACGPCSGTGKRRTRAGKEPCEFCGGNGARYDCHQRDCYEYGCSFGLCHVADDDAARAGYPR